MRVKILGKSWKKDLKDQGIEVVPVHALKTLLNDFPRILICSRCSRNKNTTKESQFVKDLYISNTHSAFCKWAISLDREYGILSDKHGLIFHDEKIEYYDVHPSQLTDDDFIQLSLMIKNKMKKRKYDAFLFYNPSPLMSIPYFTMMSLTKFPIHYTTQLYPVVKRGFFK